VRPLLLILLVSIFVQFVPKGYSAIETEYEMWTYDSKGRRDPFVPLRGTPMEAVLESEGYTGNFTLEGIIFDPEEGSLAVINGQVVRRSDQYQGYTIVEITEHTVELAREDESFTLTLDVANL